MNHGMSSCYPVYICRKQNKNLNSIGKRLRALFDSIMADTENIGKIRFRIFLNYKALKIKKISILVKDTFLPKYSDGFFITALFLALNILNHLQLIGRSINFTYTNKISVRVLFTDKVGTRSI